MINRIITIAAALILANSICLAQNRQYESDTYEVLGYKQGNKIMIPIPKDDNTTSLGRSKRKVTYDLDDLEDMDAFGTLKRKSKTYALNPGFKGSLKVGRGTLAKEGGKSVRYATLDLNLGVQFTRVIYAGIGWGYFGNFNDKFFNNSELFADVRFTMPTRFTPYIEIRGGYRPFYMQTPYWAPELGVRYGLSKALGVSLGLSYENICEKNCETKLLTGVDNVYDKYWNRGFMFKLGVDF